MTNSGRNRYCFNNKQNNNHKKLCMTVDIQSFKNFRFDHRTILQLKSLYQTLHNMGCSHPDITVTALFVRVNIPHQAATRILILPACMYTLAWRCHHCLIRKSSKELYTTKTAPPVKYINGFRKHRNARLHISFQAVFEYTSKYMHSDHFIYSRYLFNDWDMRGWRESHFLTPLSFPRFTGPSACDLPFNIQILFRTPLHNTGIRCNVVKQWNKQRRFVRVIIFENCALAFML
jgi:hypothetical protein